MRAASLAPRSHGKAAARRTKLPPPTSARKRKQACTDCVADFALTQHVPAMHELARTAVAPAAGVLTMHARTRERLMPPPHLSARAKTVPPKLVVAWAAPLPPAPLYPSGAHQFRT